MRPKIAVVDYKKGNLQSVRRGLAAFDVDAFITDDANEIVCADAVVLPGVGAFADAMNTMNELGQTESVRSSIDSGKPFLGICLGMHLMFESGVEHCEDGIPTLGLNVIHGLVDKIPSEDADGNQYKIPHVGWNSVEYADKQSELFDGIEDGTYFYFTHSYMAPQCDEVIANTTHSLTFPCAVQKGNAFGVQFHPEKSSDAGAKLLQNFVNVVKQS